jgi:catechol 2,3-dioxygenase-like lactoylglutathione lyase family enzyme
MRSSSPRSLIDLDHPMLKVRDLAAARAAYQRLGFTVTPYRTNNPMGGGTTGGKGGNHLVMLTPQTPNTTNMIELAYCDEAYAWPALRELLGGPEGLALMVHSPTDANQVREEWEAAGIACEPVFEVKTDFVDVETGHRDLIHFRVAQPSGRDWIYPFGAAQILDFRHYLRPDWCKHENGAQYWSEIALIVPEDAMAAGITHLDKVYGFEPAPDADGNVRVQINKIALRLLRPAYAETIYEGIPLHTEDAPRCHTVLTVKVESIDRLLSLLSARGVTTYSRADGVYVAPIDVCGVLMRFIQA